MSRGSRLGKWVFAGIIAVIGLGFVSSLAWIAGDELKPGRVVEDKPSSSTLHPVTVRTPDGQALVDSGRKDEFGRPVMVACATCHDTRDPDFDTGNVSELDEFHQGLQFHHGGQSCLSCHNAEDYDTLKRADGRTLEFNQSLELCAQCHGTQHRDYEAGSHGGMTGYWDLTRGERTRNTCTDCHDPHLPAFPKVMPVFPPKPVRGESPNTNTHE